jgi:hypothetical protein
MDRSRTGASVWCVSLNTAGTNLKIQYNLQYVGAHIGTDGT